VFVVAAHDALLRSEIVIERAFGRFVEGSRIGEFVGDTGSVSGGLGVGLIMVKLLIIEKEPSPSLPNEGWRPIRGLVDR